MEEKNNTTAEKLSYEKLEQAAMQLQQRLMMAESRLRSIDFASMRLTWLFRVIENKGAFTPEFVNKCSEEVQELLTLEEAPEEKCYEEAPEEKAD